MTFTLSGSPGAADFIVYAKIVDTVAGNTDTSGLDLQGWGVTELPARRADTNESVFVQGGASGRTHVKS